MHGWEIVVTRCPDGMAVPKRQIPLASWLAGPGGKAWLEALVDVGAAVDMDDGSGMARYGIEARVFLALLRRSVPPLAEAPTKGDEFSLPGALAGTLKVSAKRLRTLDPYEQITVQAWGKEWPAQA